MADTNEKGSNKATVVAAVIGAIATAVAALIGLRAGQVQVNIDMNQQFSVEYSRGYAAGYEDGSKLGGTANSPATASPNEATGGMSTQDITTTGQLSPKKLTSCVLFNEQKFGGNARFREFKGEYVYDNMQQAHSSGIIFEYGKNGDSLYRIYLLDESYSMLRGWFSIAWPTRTRPMEATLYIMNENDMILKKSKLHANGVDPELIEVPITGVKKLKIEVKGTGEAQYGTITAFGFYDAELT